MRITVLAGGVGGARFLQGVRAYAAGLPGSEVTAIINTGDDVTMHGLRICPDLDSVMYTLAGAVDAERGWGREGESWRIMDELTEYGAEPTWFSLGDLDIATHLVRTQMLAAGYPLSDVTAALCQRWQTGVRLLPMTDERCETHVVITDHGSRRAIHFQEWWVRHRAGIPALEFVQVGLESARPAAGVVAAIEQADLVLIAPSNPVVSINTILNVPGIGQALRSGPAQVIGLSPIIGGAPVRGMADACLPVLGVQTSAAGVAGLYGARSDGGVLDGWLVHTGDTAELPGLTVLGRDLLMTSPEATAAMVADAVSMAGR
ncbi:MAG TPA: 2-phospho-L-lactate transferase [Jatrophihabitans sp.]|uniref:2-phospho-L-lactate transferase n=1 Tax=Jatrophihabitans sp. TaxID=1932789 RepID=UPI002F0CF2F4